MLRVHGPARSFLGLFLDNVACGGERTQHIDKKRDLLRERSVFKGFLCAISESKIDKKLRVLEGARNMRAKSAEKLREENISICNN